MVSNGFKSSTRLQTQLPGNDFQWPVSAKSRTDRAVLESGLPCSAPIRGALSKPVRFSGLSTSRTRRRATAGGASHEERRTIGVYGHLLCRNDPPHAWPSPPLAQTRPLDLRLGAKPRPLLVDQTCERENLHGGRPWDSAQAWPCLGPGGWVWPLFCDHTERACPARPACRPGPYVHR